MPWTLDGKDIEDVKIVGGGVSTTDPVFQPRFENSISNIALPNAVDTQIFIFNGEGVLQAIMIQYSKDKVDFELKIDGSQVLFIGIDDLGDPNEYDLDSATGFPVRQGGNADQIIIDFGGQPAGFNVSFEIRSTGRAGGVNTKSHLMVYREKV